MTDDDFFSVLLDAVGAGFIERVHEGVVGVDFFITQLAENDVADDVEAEAVAACILGEEDAGADLMRAA